MWLRWSKTALFIFEITGQCAKINPGSQWLNSHQGSVSKQPKYIMDHSRVRGRQRFQKTIPQCSKKPQHFSNSLKRGQDYSHDCFWEKLNELELPHKKKPGTGPNGRKWRPGEVTPWAEWGFTNYCPGKPSSKTKQTDQVSGVRVTIDLVDGGARRRWDKAATGEASDRKESSQKQKSNKPLIQSIFQHSMKQVLVQGLPQKIHLQTCRGESR